MLTSKEAFDLFDSQILVTRQQVTLAKAFMMDHFNKSPIAMIELLLQHVQKTVPRQILVNGAADTELEAKAAAEAISWVLAGREAVWELISANLLVPTNHQLDESVKLPGWATAHGSVQAPVKEIYFPVPLHVTQPYSFRKQAPQVMSDPDLFLHTLDIEGLHPDVEDALREAVRCFRHELYLACLTMLGKASEGAWIELGLKLAEVDQSKISQRLKEYMESPVDSITRKINKIHQFYCDKGLCGRIHSLSGIRPHELQNTQVWSDCVRLSRNSIHYGNNPPMPNNYEKTAALLVGSVQHLRPLYRIMSAVDSSRSED